MRFNGKDLREVSRALSVKREIPPGTAARTIRRMSAAGGAHVSGVAIGPGEYVAEINIAAKSREEAWDARALLAAWATTDAPAMLEPTHWPGKAYDAILSEISPPEFVMGFAVVRLVFEIPRPVAYSVIPQTAAGTGGTARMIIGGTAQARPWIRQTIAEDRDGATLTIDGKPLLEITGALSAGQAIEMDTKRESVTIDGEDAMARVNAQATSWRPGFAPGVHEIAGNDAGTIEAGWQDEWL